MLNGLIVLSFSRFAFFAKMREAIIVVILEPNLCRDIFFKIFITIRLKLGSTINLNVNRVFVYVFTFFEYNTSVKFEYNTSVKFEFST
jgi:hypothetical protein